MKNNKTLSLRRKFGITVSALFLFGSFASGIAANVAKPNSTAATVTTAAKRLDLPGFEEPLFAIGTPTDDETAALKDAFSRYSAQANYAGLANVEDFLTRYPNSAWRVGVQTNLGLAYYHNGAFSSAIAAWEDAWKLGSSATEKKQKAMVDRAYGELARMHARLGHSERITALLDESKGRTLIGSATEAVAGAKEGLWVMNNDPGIAYLCGPAALRSVMKAIAPNDTDHLAELEKARSGKHGFSLNQVNELAKQVGMPYRMARRLDNAPLPLPVVVHWKVNHYAAVLAVENNQYHVKDPIFGTDLWVPKEVLDKESDGYFLIPENKMDNGWVQVASTDAEKIYGMGFTGSRDPNRDGPGDKKNCDCDKQPQPPGMPQYAVHSMLVSLNITDSPVGYSSPLGENMYSTLTYNQREANQPANFSFSNLGPKWTINWISYVQDDPYNYAVNVKRMAAGGGAVDYTGYSSTTGEFVIEAQSGAQLVRVLSGSTPTSTCYYSGAAVGDFVRCLKDGSKEVYGYSDGSTIYPRRTFLTKKIDRSGNVVTLNYETISDSPPAWNPADKDPYYDLSNSNKTVDFSRKVTAGNIGFMRANTRIEGKKYFEVVVDSIASGGVGIGIDGLAHTASDTEYWFLGHTDNGVGIYSDQSVKFNLSHYDLETSPFTTGAVIGVAVDQPNGMVWFNQDGTWVKDGAGNTGNPASGTNPALTFSGYYRNAGMKIVEPIYPAISGWYSTTATVRFSGLSYTPSGFSAITAAGLVRLVSVVDAASKTTSFDYENTDEPLQITKITDPYERHADITYDTDGRLHSITDAVSMESVFTYKDAGDFIEKMTTPYGDTTFSATDGAVTACNGATYPNRVLEITDPLGNKERTEYLGAAPATGAASTIPYNDTPPDSINYFSYTEAIHESCYRTATSFLDGRNTFYWDKSAYQSAYDSSAHTMDYSKAEVTHWLHMSDTNFASGVIESIKHPNESRIWFNYPGQGGGTGSLGYAKVGTLEAPNKVGRILDDTSTQLTTLDRNSLGKVTCSIDPTGVITVYSYATNMVDLLDIYKKPKGGSGTCSDDVSTFQHINNYVYGDTTNNPRLPTSVTEYHPLGSSTSNSANTTVYTYNSHGQVLTATNALGQVTTYSYLTNGSLEKIFGPNSSIVPVVTFTYDTAGRVATSTNAEGYALTFTYDDLNRLLTITYPDTTPTHVTYAYSKLDVHTITDRYGNVKTSTYDNGRNLTAQNINSDVWAASYQYYANGQPKYVIDGVGNVTAYVVDGESRVTQVQQGSSDAFTLTGSPTLDNTDSHNTTYEYEANTSRLKSVTDANSATTHYTYDRANRLATVTDAVGHVTTYTYNGIGQLDTLSSPDSGLTKFTYDNNGNLKTKTKGYISSTSSDADTLPINYSWDALNRLTKIDYPGTDQDVTYVYDSSTGCGDAYKGRLCRVIRGDAGSLSATTTSITDYTYNELGLVTAEKQYPKGSSGIMLETDYAYDSAGNLTSTTYPGGRVVNIPRTNGRVTGLNSAPNSTADPVLLSNTLNYRPFGGVTGYDMKMTSGDPWHYSQTFDTAGKLATWNVNAPDYTRTYSYDAFGNITNITGQTSDLVASYAYDNVNRLIGALGPYGYYQYTYDNVGNRLTQQKSNWDPASFVTDEWMETYAYASGSNRLTGTARRTGSSTTSTPYRTRAFAYDNRGNIKTDTRTVGSTPTILNLNHGNGDRIDCIKTGSSATSCAP